MEGHVGFFVITTEEEDNKFYMHGRKRTCATWNVRRHARLPLQRRSGYSARRRAPVPPGPYEFMLISTLQATTRAFWRFGDPIPSFDTSTALR